MKVAYVFSTSGHTASYKLGRMILPQLEQGTHGVEVVGMFFFDDNTYVLRAGDPVGERLGRVAAEHGMLLMLCDQCALERGLAEGEIGAARADGNGRGRAGRLLPRPLRGAGGRPAGPRHHAVRGPNWSSVGSAQQNHGSVSRGLPSVDPIGDGLRLAGRAPRRSPRAPPRGCARTSGRSLPARRRSAGLAR